MKKISNNRFDNNSKNDNNKVRSGVYKKKDSEMKKWGVVKISKNRNGFILVKIKTF